MNLIKELRKLKKLEQNYRKASMDFVERWAEFVKTHPDKEWSKQHNKFIDSELEKMSKNQPTREEYLKMKGEWRGN